mgnify:CR=1 FL=1
MVGIIHFQIGEKIVEGRRAIVLLVLNRRRPEHFHYHSEILLLLRGFIPDISDECRIIELFSLHPEVLTGLLSLSFGVDYNRVYKFQNILLAPNVGERIVMHGFSKVYGI